MFVNTKSTPKWKKVLAYRTYHSPRIADFDVLWSILTDAMNIANSIIKHWFCVVYDIAQQGASEETTSAKQRQKDKKTTNNGYWVGN